MKNFKNFYFFKNTKLKILLVLFLFFVFESVHAENAAGILSDVRERFPIVIEEMCHSSVIYSLDMPLETAKKLYHETQNCLFDQSVVSSVNSMNKDFKSLFKKFKSDFSEPKLSIKAKNCKKGRIFSMQEMTPIDHGYISRCMEGNSVKTIYSACHVSETAWNEFCAYQEYLSWKKIDDSLQTEFNSQKENLSTASDWRSYREKMEKNLELELNNSKKTLEESLRQYQHFEQNYRSHLWLEVIKAALKITRKKTKDIKTAIEKWPSKFHDRASSICDQ